MLKKVDTYYFINFLYVCDKNLYIYYMNVYVYIIYILMLFPEATSYQIKSSVLDTSLQAVNQRPPTPTPDLATALDSHQNLMLGTFC